MLGIKEVKSWNYNEEIMKIMNEDKVNLIKREIVGSGDDTDDNNDDHAIGTGDIGAAEIMALSVCIVIVLAIFVFVAACTWNKAKIYYNRRSNFTHLFNQSDSNDESMLYMVDYDELNRQDNGATLKIEDQKELI